MSWMNRVIWFCCSVILNYRCMSGRPGYLYSTINDFRVEIISVVQVIIHLASTECGVRHCLVRFGKMHANKLSVTPLHPLLTLPTERWKVLSCGIAEQSASQASRHAFWLNYWNHFKLSLGSYRGSRIFHRKQFRISPSLASCTTFPTSTLFLSLFLFILVYIKGKENTPVHSYHNKKYF